MNPTKIFLKAPCANCPFLKVGAIELHPGRLEEIVNGCMVHDDRPFMCHKTLDLETRAYCVGAMVFLLKAGRSHIGMRLGRMLNMYDPEALESKYRDAVVEPESYE